VEAVSACKTHLCHVGNDAEHLPSGDGDKDSETNKTPPHTPTDSVLRTFGKL